MSEEDYLPRFETLASGVLGNILRASEATIAEYEKLIGVEKEIIKAIKTTVGARMDEDGSRALSTKAGTFHFVSRTTARVMDPAQLQDFVIYQNQPGAIDWKANAVWCRKFAEENKTPVPGVELSSIRQVRITAPRPDKPKYTLDKE